MDAEAAAPHTVGVRVFAEPAAFLEQAGPFLLADEAEHSLVLGLLGGMVARAEHPASLLVTVEAGGAVIGCAFRTPPEKLVLTRMPAAAVPALLAAVAERCDVLPAVHGPAPATARFAAAWAARLGLQVRPGMQQGIYELTHVIEHGRAAPGTLRRAVHRDVPLITEWLAAFGREADHPLRDPGAVARARIGRGSFWLWEDGEPVSVAGRMGRTPHGERIGFVYTPPERRGRGYASTLVARLSQQVLAEGLRFCSLYTDLSNATSNAIYQRIGYRRVAEVADFVFVPAG